VDQVHPTQEQSIINLYEAALWMKAAMVGRRNVTSTANVLVDRCHPQQQAGDAGREEGLQNNVNDNDNDNNKRSTTQNARYKMTSFVSSGTLNLN